MKLKIGTRGSKLALYQANLVAEKLREADSLIECEIVVIKTTGDKIQNVSLCDIGGKALFLKEIESALQNGSIDIAVHSTKDVPGFLPEGLVIDCYLERQDPRDVFISYKYKSLSEMPKGATVGTCAPRRRGFLYNMRPDFNFETFRGNVPTRLDKLKKGEVDGTIFALSGLKRLGLEHEITEILSPQIMLPAVGQGAICVERRVEDNEIATLLGKINHDLTHKCVSLERQFLQNVDGDCDTPLAAYTEDGQNIDLWLASVDFKKVAAHKKVHVGEIIEIAEQMKLSIKS